MGKVKLITAIASIFLAVINLNNGITIVIATENENETVKLENSANPDIGNATENEAVKLDSAKPDITVDRTQLEPTKKLEETEITPSISTSPETTLDKAKQNGEKLYKARACNACHGDDAQTPSQPFYPKLAGQKKEYIIIQMNDFQNGLRTNGFSTVMKGGMATIKNQEEIEIIAEWLESLTNKNPKSATTNDANGASLYQSKICNTCHGEDAKSPNLPFYPKLAGQNQKYAIAQMRDIKSGKRNNSNSAFMKGVMQGVNNKEIKAIAEWLASLDW